MIANRAASRAFDQIGTIVVDQASIGIGSKSVVIAREDDERPKRQTLECETKLIDLTVIPDGRSSEFKTPVFLAWLQAWPDRTKISLLTVPVGNEVA